MTPVPSAVLVTGGTKGIGRAVVETLLARGRPVAFTWRSDEDGAREIESTWDLARGFRLDLRERERPGALVREVEAALGPLHGLVNSAGLHRSALLALTADASWDELLDVNLGGAFRMTRAVLPGMVARRCGSIVNVSSLVAVSGLPGESAYAAAKAGLLGMTRSLAREVGSRGIRVNAVLPGVVRTGMTEDLAPAADAFLASLRVLPREVSPGDVAATVAFLVSDEAASITGQELVVDAGASA